MPRKSSVGWFGCSRVESRPASPIVLRKAVDDAAFGGDDDEVLQAHDFRHGGGHLRGQTRSQLRSGGRSSSAYRAATPGTAPTVRWDTGRESRRIVAVEDQARNLVLFIRDKIDVQEGLEGKIGQRHLGRDALDRALRRDAGQRISRSRRRGLGEKRLEIGKNPARAVDRRSDRTCNSASRGLSRTKRGGFSSNRFTEGGRRVRYSCTAPAIRRDRRASRFATISNRIDRPIINVAAAVIAGLSCSRRPVNISSGRVR